MPSSQDYGSTSDRTSNTEQFRIPNIVLKAALNTKKQFNIAHFNAQSILPKIDEVRFIFSDVNVHAICVSESWLKNYITDNAISLGGFNVFRNDRPSKRGGGVCVFIRSEIPAKVVYKSTNAGFEVLCIEIILSNDKILLGVVYNPPGSNFESELENIFSEFSITYSNFILVGDFNCDMLSHSTKRTAFNEILERYSINQCNQEPTHFTKTSSSLLDLVLCNSDGISFLSQISVPGMSFHDLLFFSYDILPLDKVNSITFRDFNNIKYNELFEYCRSITWNAVFDMESIDNQIMFFNDKVMELFDLFVPLKTLRIKLSKPEWFASNIVEAIRLRNKAYSRWTRYRSDSTWNEYALLRNKVTTLKRNSKRVFASKKLDPKLPPRLFWKNLNKLGIGKSTESIAIPFTSNELNRYYCSQIDTSSSTHDHSYSNSVVNSIEFSDTENSPLLGFQHINSLQLYKAIYAIKSDAVGPDGVSIKFIKLIFPLIAPYLLFIFNNIITKSYFPVCWKSAKITPIPKVKNPTLMSELRPISLLPALAKAFEFVIKTQISCHLQSNNLLCSYQSAYRSGYSTTSALLTITDDIRRQADVGRFTVLTLLDFSKAFDSICHSILCKKLATLYNFSSSACRLVYSYLAGRSQVVEVNGTLSEAMPILRGVPQGSVLGPLLFSLYINDVGNSLKHCKFHLFADDLQIYISDMWNNRINCITRLNDDLQSILSWSIRNKLILNTNKTQAILLFKNKLSEKDFPQVLLNNERVVFSDTVRNLGLIMDKTLSWNEHVNGVCSKVYRMLRVLWKTTCFLSTKTRHKLFMAYILPHILYCDVVLFGMHVGVMYKLKRLFNSCVRFVFSLRKYDHISQFRNRLLGCNIDKYLDMRTCIYIHRIVSGESPSYLFEKFDFANSSRTRHITLPTNRSRIYNSSFYVSGVKLYNKLPLPVRSNKSEASFKVLYKKHLNFELNLINR